MSRKGIPLFYSAKYSVEPWPEKHRFRFPKFRLLEQVLREKSEFPTDNIVEVVKPDDFHYRLKLGHSQKYIEAIKENTFEEWRAVGFPWSPELIERCELECMGTLLAAKAALTTGIACNLAGGTHHASYDRGSGFCIFNDLAFTALNLLDEGLVKSVLILDMDVHQGNGTAVILEDQKDVFTCSMHCEKNFPFRKARSDLDVGLESGLGDEEYLREVDGLLENLFIERKLRPCITLYDAGVDVHKNDRLGYLNITDEGIRERDRRVLSTCLDMDSAVATVIGGGYDKNDIRLAHRHSIVSLEAYEMAQRFSLIS